MKCSYCNTNIDMGLNTCPKCGGPVTNNQEEKKIYKINFNYNNYPVRANSADQAAQILYNRLLKQEKIHIGNSFKILVKEEYKEVKVIIEIPVKYLFRTKLKTEERINRVVERTYRFYKVVLNEEEKEELVFIEESSLENSRYYPYKG